ncbi:MAG: hypothetical protein U1C51_00375 [Candidatus Izemoplasmatales bacterium]|nr:hypothetical protein [bacterium]MDZ4195683.1 hypothetical protein [Candidatus Izemoplasmatales bacterium]
MNDSKLKVSIDSTNRHQHMKAIEESSDQELKLYESFYQKIVNKATTHRQVSINHLTEVGERLEALKHDAEVLRNRITYHHEEVVVNRQKVIRTTEMKVHEENSSVLTYDHDRLPETIHSIDYLSQAIKQLKIQFMELYSRLHVTNLLDSEDLFAYFLDKSAHVEMILSRHNQVIYDHFHDLDHQVSSMDKKLTELLRTKNQKIQSIHAFYESEIAHYIDNQLTFTHEEDPTSITIQALESDKHNQLTTFKKHQEMQHRMLKSSWEAEYATLHQRLVIDYLHQSAANYNVDRTIFDDVVKRKETLSSMLPALNPKTQAPEIQRIHKQLFVLSKYPELLKKASAKATKILSKQHARKVALIKISELLTLDQTHELDKTYQEYKSLMQIDPFLAQTWGDRSSKIIKQFRTQLEVLRVNNELKTNIEYDIQMTQLKHEINQLELSMMYEVKEVHLILEKELLIELIQIHEELLERSLTLFESKKKIAFERIMIERVEQTAAEHLRLLLEQQTSHRVQLATTVEKLVQHIRKAESHEIYVGDAKGELDYLLKQYDMKALYFKTLYENELAFFVSQRVRVDEGQKIHYAFVLTSFENQMRFAEEQVKLANFEYRTRLESFLKVADEQKQYHQSQVDHLYQLYQSNLRRVEEDYQATLYATTHLLSETPDKKQRMALQKSLATSTQEYEKKKRTLDNAYQQHPIVTQADERLTHLDEQLQRAIEDAENLRDKTIAQYSELYHKAKERYDALKPYVDENINVMDPVFFDHLERIKGNYIEAQNAAEAELEQLVAPHLQRYLEVYFSDQTEPNYIEYKQQINDIEQANTLLEKQSNERLLAIEQDYSNKLKEINAFYKTQTDQVQPLLSTIEAKKKSIVQDYAQLLSSLEKERIDQATKTSKTAVQTIETLTSEYHKALKQDAKMAQNMSDDFEKLLHGYLPYIQLMKKRTKFHRQLRQIQKTVIRSYKTSKKGILKKYRRYQIPTQS